MRLPADPRLPAAERGNESLTRRLYELFRQISIAFNDSFMWSSSGTSAPTTGTWAQGDKVKNSSPTEAGTAGSKYVVIGWVCTVSGTSGTWVEMRCLTGN